MVSLEEAARMAMALPDVTVGQRYSSRTWFVAGKAFAWDRGFSKADLKRFGDEPPPAGPIMAMRVEDLAEKEAVLAAGIKGVFTIPHFDNYPAILIQLKVIPKAAFREALEDAWLACAPAKLATSYMEQR